MGEGGKERWGLCFVTLMKHRFLLGLFGASFAGDIHTSLCSHIHPFVAVLAFLSLLSATRMSPQEAISTPTPGAILC